MATSDDDRRDTPNLDLLAARCADPICGCGGEGERWGFLCVCVDADRLDVLAAGQSEVVTVKAGS